MIGCFPGAFRSRKFGLLLLILPLLLSGCKESGITTAGCRDCNIVLILIDALRPDHLPCYGYDEDTAPAIDRLAGRGIIFGNAISQSSWTKASVASLFTSLYPHNHQAKKWRDVLPLEITTLAEELKRHGYRTFAVQTNTFIQTRHNFDQGFDEYVESAYPECTADLVVDRAMEFFDGIEAEPKKFFAYLHFMDTHFPYDAPEAYQRKFIDDDHVGYFDLTKVPLKNIRSGAMQLFAEDKAHIQALYDAEIRFVDDQIRELIDRLKQSGLFDDTLFIITSDHGEEFWEHGGFEHGHSMYNELLRVPLIICHPGLETRKKIGQLVRLIDVFPTLMGILDLDTEAEMMGVDLSEILAADKEIDLGLLGFSEAILYGDEKKAIQSAHFKFIKRMGTPVYELYDLDKDRRERNDLRKKRNEFKKLFHEYRKAESRPYRRVKKNLDEKAKKILESLGYIK